MRGTGYIIQKALYGMSAQRTVSMQEVVCVVDNQDLVVCSEKFMHLSLLQGAMLTSNKDRKQTDIVSIHCNWRADLCQLFLDEYFYKEFCSNVLNDTSDGVERTKHRILLLVGQTCKPQYPVTYEYANGALMQYRTWSKEKPLTKLLSDKKKIIRIFKLILDKKKIPISVTSQYILAIKYSQQAELELLSSKASAQPYDLSNVRNNEKDDYIAHHHISQCLYNKHHREILEGVTVDIGKMYDYQLREWW